jgi:hypothetical protein
MRFGRYDFRLVTALILVAGLSLVVAVTGKQMPLSSESQIDPFVLMSTATQLPNQEWNAI